MKGLVATSADSPLCEELLRPEALAQLAESDPMHAADALLEVSTLEELSAGRASWLPALLLTARPSRAARMLLRLARLVRERCDRPLGSGVMRPLVLLLGSSDWLGRVLLDHPEWVFDLDGDPPPRPSALRPAAGSDWSEIREARLRGLLRVSVRELLGCPLEESLKELSALTDRCLIRALECAAREAGGAAPTTLVLGSLGGREATLASTIELLLLAGDGEDVRPASNRYEAFVSGLIWGLTKDEGEGEGVLYRICFGPEQRWCAESPVVSPRAAAEHVRRLAVSTGGLVARSSFLSARPLLDRSKLGGLFLRGIEPVLYSPLGRAALELPVAAASDDDLRWGAGGIRQLELYVHQLVVRHGAEDGRVRLGGVQDALRALGTYGQLSESVARTLGDAYDWLRRAEHFLQLVDGEPVHHFPSDPVEQIALARRMGYRELDAARSHGRILRDWRCVRDQVLTLTEIGPKCADEDGL